MRHVLLQVLTLCAALVMPPGVTAARSQDVADGGLVRIDPDLIAELVFGIYCAEDPVRTEDAPETASGVINIVPDLPRIRFAQNVVPAALDVGFGVLSRAPDGMTHDPVTITVTHPPFPGSGIEVERWTTRLGDGDFNLTGFSFDVPQELVTGTWTFSAHAGASELFHVVFEVVPPDMAAPVLAECQTGFTS
ncbi:DUF3859 domain-containing protein [Roseibacterium sp. SDUM158017]|uniref:DUF3859 domain-containing protein n=1 Tax=Roseicyclus salinarum TaxID=3036773 RepID=UPI00241589FD|nr:DUF3859 domain-containing protein [Roseibacterium sp. SDUM158017]MDG4649048.1 DUF3859 domain-containing protein [Roseibacterium sp. SDUM158017]